MNKLWIEKYRPKKFDDVVGQKNVVSEVRKVVEGNNIPHLLFYGPAGVGKTTLAYIISREMFGDGFRSNFMELNASDERGIQTIRDKVKGFAKVNPLGAKFKIIFLDEADYLTLDAQASLRRVMEMYSNTTRFILSCNYVNKIIPAIQSRCKLYGFGKLNDDDVIVMLKRVLVNEGKKLDDSVLKEVVRGCGGDLRRCLNELQALCVIDGATLERVRNSEGYFVKEILEGVREKSYIKARLGIDKMLKGGWSERIILLELRNRVVERDNVDCKILLELMKADERLLCGVDKDLVFDGLISEIIL